MGTGGQTENTMKTNCPNCGAPIDANLHKCPYCGTNYYDLSYIDMDAGPFFIKVKTHMYYQNKEIPVIITAKAQGTYNGIDINTNYDYLYTTAGNVSLPIAKSATLNMKFDLIADDTKLFTMEACS